jgi:hypothetical protein
LKSIRLVITRTVVLRNGEMEDGPIGVTMVNGSNPRHPRYVKLLVLLDAGYYLPIMGACLMPHSPFLTKRDTMLIPELGIYNDVHQSTTTPSATSSKG